MAILHGALLLVLLLLLALRGLWSYFCPGSAFAKLLYQLERIFYYKVTRDEEKTYRKEFEYMDTDKDQKVTKQELQKASFLKEGGRLVMSEQQRKEKGKPKMTSSDKKSLFNEIDINKDGTLSYEEYKTFRIKAKGHPYRRRRYAAAILVVLVVAATVDHIWCFSDKFQGSAAQDVSSLQLAYKELREESHYYKMTDEKTQKEIKSPDRCAEKVARWRTRLQTIDGNWSKYNVDASDTDMDLVITYALCAYAETVLVLLVIAVLTSYFSIKSVLSKVLGMVALEEVTEMLETCLSMIEEFVYDIFVTFLIAILVVTLFFPNSIASVGDTIDANNDALAARHDVMEKMRVAPVNSWGPATCGLPCGTWVKEFIEEDMRQRLATPFGVQLHFWNLKLPIPTGSVWPWIVKLPYECLEAVDRHGIVGLVAVAAFVLGGWPTSPGEGDKKDKPKAHVNKSDDAYSARDLRKRNLAGGNVSDEQLSAAQLRASNQTLTRTQSA